MSIDPTRFSRLEITNPRYARQWIPLRRAGVSESLPPVALGEDLSPIRSVRQWALVAEFKIKARLSRRLDGASGMAVLHVVDAARGSTYAVQVNLRLVDAEHSPERPVRWAMRKKGQQLARRNREADREFQAQTYVRAVAEAPEWL